MNKNLNAMKHKFTIKPRKILKRYNDKELFPKLSLGQFENFWERDWLNLLPNHKEVETYFF